MDHSNKSFYANLGQTVKTLEDIGKIGDISVLRKALSDNVRRLKNTVTSQEAFASEALGGMRDTLETAKTSIKGISRLVSSEALDSLPGRRHAEQFIGELIGKERPFSLGVVRVDGTDRVARRYGDGSAKRVLQQFSEKLGAHVSQQVYPYRWTVHAFVVVSDQLREADLRTELSEFLRRSGAGPFEVDEKSGRTASTDAHSVVHRIKAGLSADKVHKLIDGFCHSAA